MYKDEFSRYHPLVNFCYFAIVIIFSMILMHPLALAISFLLAFIYSIKLKGKEFIKSNILFMLMTLLFTALINPAFNHEGQTILTYLPSGNPLTLESIAYGLATATMFLTVISWFSSYNEVMTSDKFIYLFAKIIPSLSLIISMIFRFVPLFKTKFEEVSYAQKAIGKDISKGSIIIRIKTAVRILSITITWMLDNALDTADSMKSRGYGLKDRTAFSIYKFERKDNIALTFLLILAIYIIIAYFNGSIKYRYYPTMKGSESSIYYSSVFFAYFSLCFLPLYINWKEERKWKYSQLKT